MQEKCKCFVQFQGQMLMIEEFGGMNSHLIMFNPQDNEGYKIQVTEKVFLQFDGDNKFINIYDNEKHFLMVNSSGNVIADSVDLKSDFVETMLTALEKQNSEEPQCMN